MAAAWSRVVTNPQCRHTCPRSESRLGFASPHGQRLARSKRIDGREPSPGAFGLVRKLSKECRPSCIVYRFSQPATGQTFYVQVFDKNYSVAVDDLSRQLVLKIVALVENFAVNPGDQANRFLQRFENFSRRATRPWARRRRFCAFWNKRGLPIRRPSLRVTNDNSPTSRPTALSFAGSGSGSTMQPCRFGAAHLAELDCEPHERPLERL